MHHHSVNDPELRPEPAGIGAQIDRLQADLREMSGALLAAHRERDRLRVQLGWAERARETYRRLLVRQLGESRLDRVLRADEQDRLAAAAGEGSVA